MSNIFHKEDFSKVLAKARYDIAGASASAV